MMESDYSSSDDETPTRTHYYCGMMESDSSSSDDETPTLPLPLPLSLFLSRFRDRYVGKTQDEFKDFWSSGEELSDSPDEQVYEPSDDEEVDSDEEQKYVSQGRHQGYRPRKRNQPTLSYRRRRIQKAKEIVQEFIEQVENHRYAEFNWPPDRKCLALRCNHLAYYLRKLPFEEEKSVDEEDEVAKLFLDQVRSSWGYAVTINAPAWLRSLLYPISVHCDKHWNCYGDWVMTAVSCAVKRINAGAKEKGKTYFPEEILNVVYAPPGLMLLTLLLKEVDSEVWITVRAGVTLALTSSTRKPELEECKLIPTPV